MTRAATYLRRSKKKSASEQATATNTLSVEDQRKRVEDLVAREKYERVQEFCDDGLSAWREDVQRKDFNALCALIESGGCDVVVSDAADRLTRQGGRAYLAFLELCAANGVKVHTVESGLVDPQDESSEIPAFLSGWQAKKESQDKSRRLRNYVTERAQEGKPRRAGVRPFGWNEDKMTLHPQESALMREAVAHVLKGGAIGTLVRQWNDAGVTTTRGGRWSRSGMKFALMRERMAGLVVLRGEVLPDVEASWEPIISEQEWRDLCVMLGAKGGPRADVKHLLSGLIRCHCGQVMRGATGGRQEQVYRCAVGTDPHADRSTGMAHVSVVREDADEHVTKALAGVLMLSPLDSLATPETARLAALYGALSDAQAQVGNLVEAVASGALSHADVKTKRAALDAETESLQAQIDRVVKSNAHAALVADLHRTLWKGSKVSFDDAVEVKRQIRERFEALPIADKRTLIRTMLRSVTVYPGRGVQRIDVQADVLDEHPEAV